MTKTKTKTRDEPTLFADAKPAAVLAKAAKHSRTESKAPVRHKSQPSHAVAIAEPKMPAEPKNMLAIIAAAAANPAVDVAKMEALLRMQREIVAEEARIAFVEDFIGMQSELPVINRTGKIEIPPKDGKKGQVTPYATFNEINRVTKPILQRHNFSLAFHTEAGPDGRLVVHGTLAHKRGYARETTLALPLETSGSKNNVQGVGSSMSYGKRYAAIALLNLVSDSIEDRDDDGISAAGKSRAAKVEIDGEIVRDDTPRLTQKQLDDLRDAIEACGVGADRFKAHYQIQRIEDLPPSRLAEAMKACRDFITKRGRE